MPVSDYLVSLALALHPHGDAKLPLTLNADAVVQPSGGAPTLILADLDANANARNKSQACANGKHIAGVKYEDRHIGKAAQQSTLTTTRGEHKGGVKLDQATTGHVKGESVNACAAGEHFPK
jgi:hypothetical protein